MRQVLQNYRTGAVESTVVPVPLCSSDSILLKNATSLVSIGTERSIIELGRKSLLEKARTRPDLLKRFMGKARTEGLIPTFKTALQMLDKPVSLGYSCAGVAAEVGGNIHKFGPGDRIASIGSGFASHAEYVAVPEMLCSRIPEGVSFEEASFGMLGIIATNGIRCAKLRFGESVAVIGLGLLGLLTVQILKAYGCKVVGMDIDPQKAALAGELGADHVFASAHNFDSGVLSCTDGFGVDAVIITASAKSDAPVNSAVDISRYGGRIVIVGVADIHPNRNEMWHKEVELKVSKAGGPGTFDPLYESKGIDYPAGYVRWTENRNLVEFLRLIAEGRINVKPLITHRFPIKQAEAAYKDILHDRSGPYIGVILEYPHEDGRQKLTDMRAIPVQSGTRRISSADYGVCLGVIGAGLFGKALLLPALKTIKSVRLHTLATSTGATACHGAKKFGFENCATDYRHVLDSNQINAVMILTPHRLHAKMIVEAIKAGKHVFVEKPLCITQEELDQIMEVYSEVYNSKSSFPLLMAGYNRRFSPHAAKMAKYLSNRREPLVVNYRINPGFVPKDHWVHSEEEGGSRVVGEICHFVDTMQFLTQADPVRVYAERVSGNDRTVINSDNLAITLKFSDGSVGNIVYAASGDKAFSRERIEVFFDGNTIVSDDFRRTHFYLNGRVRKFKTRSQEQGYEQELRHFFDIISGRSSVMIKYRDIFVSTLTVFKINESLDKGKAVSVSL